MIRFFKLNLGIDEWGEGIGVLNTIHNQSEYSVQGTTGIELQK